MKAASALAVTTSILRHIGLRSASLKMFVEETGGELIDVVYFRQWE